MSITALRIITANDDDPITVSDAKAHLRITYSAEDGYISNLIKAASDWAQVFTGRIFMNTTVGIRTDRFPESGESAELTGGPLGHWFYIKPNTGRKKEADKRDRSILLPGGNVSSVNQIAYTDDLGAPQILTGPTSPAPGTDYQEDLTDDEWAFIYPDHVVGWPDVDHNVTNAVLIDYDVGYPTALDIPDSIKQAIRFKVADLFNIRDTLDAGSKSQLLNVAENLLEPYVVPNF